MKWILRIISVIFLSVCFGGRVLPGDMTVERRTEIIEDSITISEMTATFSAYDLAVMYDFLEKSFILADQTDLPEDAGIQKEKRASSTKGFTDQNVDGKDCHLAWRDEVFDYLSVKHIQGFYIYGINRMII